MMISANHTRACPQGPDGPELTNAPCFIQVSAKSFFQSTPLPGQAMAFLLHENISPDRHRDGVDGRRGRRARTATDVPLDDLNPYVPPLSNQVHSYRECMCTYSNNYGLMWFLLFAYTAGAPPEMPSCYSARLVAPTSCFARFVTESRAFVIHMKFLVDLGQEEQGLVDHRYGGQAC